MHALSSMLLCSALTLISLAGTTQAERKKVVAYVPNWVDLETFAGTIPYSQITHINIAFENPVNDAGELSFHAKNAYLIEKAHAHGVKILVSIGGGSASVNEVLKKRYFGLISEGQVERFAAQLGEYVAKHNFDGLDVDLEGPAINEDYGGFIDALAAVLKPQGKLLTAAYSQGYNGRAVPDSVFARLDFINIMGYDATGSWSPDKPGQHSSMAYARSGVKYWLERGLPKSKAVLGVPFYGYGFGPAFRDDGYLYSEILALHPEAAQEDKVGNTIWHNGIPTIKAKTQYVLDDDLAGVMIWSLDSDVKGPNSLMSAIHETLEAASEK